MKICLAQRFPLGRFHATPWKVFPYDDPFGEWPPSPWRLVRGLLARSHQIQREETVNVDDRMRERLVVALSASEIAWHLPAFSWRGHGIRQYQPSEFKKIPEAAKESGMFTYKTTKVQDNFWVTDGEAQLLHWFFEGEKWEDQTVDLLDQCVARMTYFGRAESITEIRRIDLIDAPEPNCHIVPNREGESIPVLCPRPDITLEQLQRTTDDPIVRNSTVPPGALWKFAIRPQRPAVRTKPRPIKRERPPVSLIQFALGSKVSPSLDHVALIANWFRGRTIRTFLIHQFGVEKGVWRNASSEAKEAVALLAGKTSEGEPIKDHLHAYFGLYLDLETGKPTRLLAWRSQPFTSAEQDAILEAASRPFSLAHREKSSKGQNSPKRDPWKVHCVPLDSAVPPPPGFELTQKHQEWISLTPYVPPRHAFNRQGKLKLGDAPEDQLRRDLERASLPIADIHLLDPSTPGEWVKVHKSGTRTEGAPTNFTKRGYRFRLSFTEPVCGPIAFGHSSHFGLGLFVPVSQES